MARSRNIKPGFFQNEHLVDLPYEYRLLFIGLWTLADREGRLEDRPKKIKMSLFPADDVDICKGLSDLGTSGFVLRYEVDNNKYIQILNFNKHQRPHHQEVESIIPSADFAEPVRKLSGEGASQLRTNPPDSLNPITDSLNLIPARAAKKISLTRDYEWEGISDQQKEKWKKAYPAISLEIELNKASAWLQANPSNKKSNYARFLTNWFSRAQDKAPRKEGRDSSGNKKPSALDGLI